MDKEKLANTAAETVNSNMVNSHYSSLGQFVDEYLTYLYPMNTTKGGVTWCEQWWKHPAAAVRFQALWSSWEDMRINGGPSGLAGWLVNYADPLMAQVFREDGPFEHCTIERGHIDERTNPGDHLPTIPPPAGLFTPSEDEK